MAALSVSLVAQAARPRVLVARHWSAVAHRAVVLSRAGPSRSCLAPAPLGRQVLLSFRPPTPRSPLVPARALCWCPLARLWARQPTQTLAPS